MPLVTINPPATQEENDLINACNHMIASDAKVAAVRSYVNRQNERMIALMRSLIPAAEIGLRHLRATNDPLALEVTNRLADAKEV